MLYQNEFVLFDFDYGVHLKSHVLVIMGVLFQFQEFCMFW